MGSGIGRTVAIERKRNPRVVLWRPRLGGYAVRAGGAGGKTMSDGRSGRQAKAEPRAQLMSLRIRDPAGRPLGSMLRARPIAGALGGLVAVAGAELNSIESRAANKEGIVVGTMRQIVEGWF